MSSALLGVHLLYFLCSHRFDMIIELCMTTEGSLFWLPNDETLFSLLALNPDVHEIVLPVYNQVSLYLRSLYVL